MEKKEIVKEYSNGDFTVVWKPGLCIHAEICAKTLPEVYNPDIRPWIKAENAAVSDLVTQIDQCPSGALSYYTRGKEKGKSDNIIKVEVSRNGPLILSGTLIVKDAEGNEVEKTNKTAFCRCGASANKPYCDGSHKKIGFQG